MDSPRSGGSRSEPVPSFWSRKQAQNITIPENLIPGSKVVQLQAQGFDVRYEILSPVPCGLFSIGRGEGCGGRVWGCLCCWSAGDLHYLLALLRNGRNWGEVVFGDLKLEASLGGGGGVISPCTVFHQWTHGRVGAGLSWGRGRTLPPPPSHPAQLMAWSGLPRPWSWRKPQAPVSLGCR